MTEVRDRTVTVGERVAEQALIAFSESETQDPIASFFPEENREFDLASYHSGTILRMEYMDMQSTGESGSEFAWYVVGDKVIDRVSGEERVFVYNVTLPRGADNAPRLPRSTGAFAMGHDPIPVRSFPVTDTKYVLEDHDLVKEIFNQRFSIKKLDVMAQGLDLEQTKPVVAAPSAGRRLN